LKAGINGILETPSPTKGEEILLAIDEMPRGDST
jgi:hypothetical protein